MSKKKLSKEEVRSPDAFITFSDKALEQLLKHKKIILLIVGAIVVAGIAKTGYQQFNKSKESSAQSALFEVRSDIDKLREKLEKTDTPKDAKADEKAKAPEFAKTPENLKKHFATTIKNYQRVIKKNKGTAAALTSAINLAYFQSEYGDSAGATTTLKSVENSVSKDQFFFGLIHTQLGTALTKQNKFKEAIDHFNMVVDNKTQTYLHADALLRLGLAYEQLKDFDRAQEMYERVTQTHPNTSAAQSAKAFMRLLAVSQPTPPQEG